MESKVSNQVLLEAGLAAMRAAGKPLEKLPTKSRAMKYRLSNGETVRVRTCNDHVLVVLADSTENGASLNIEGTDHLLIVMPKTPRLAGPVHVYFVPTPVAVKAARESHAEWLASNPSTRGNNRTWNIWFDDMTTTSHGFARAWAQYLLDTDISTHTLDQLEEVSSDREKRTLGAVIAEARKSIADAAGVGIEAVKITVALD